MPKLKKLRASAFKRQVGRCFYCDLPMWLDAPPTLLAAEGRKYFTSPALRCTAEHLLAKCDGGKDSAGNIAAACVFCNRRRHRRKCALSAEAFRDLVARRMRAGKWHGAGAGAGLAAPERCIELSEASGFRYNLGPSISPEALRA